MIMFSHTAKAQSIFSVPWIAWRIGTFMRSRRTLCQSTFRKSWITLVNFFVLFGGARCILMDAVTMQWSDTGSLISMSVINSGPVRICSVNINDTTTVPIRWKPCRWVYALSETKVKEQFKKFASRCVARLIRLPGRMFCVQITKHTQSS